jgi:hypothetical protein
VWAGEKIKNIHLDEFWWVRSSYPYPPSGRHIRAPVLGASGCPT